MSVINPGLDEIEKAFDAKFYISPPAMERKLSNARAILMRGSINVYVDYRGDLRHAWRNCRHEFEESFELKGLGLDGLMIKDRAGKPLGLPDFPARGQVLESRNGIYVVRTGAVCALYGPEPGYEKLTEEAHKFLRRGKDVYAQLGSRVWKTDYKWPKPKA